jgi:hypothetical protein
MKVINIAVIYYTSLRKYKRRDHKMNKEKTMAPNLTYVTIQFNNYLHDVRTRRFITVFTTARHRSLS